jgi:hypothetical protein
MAEQHLASTPIKQSTSDTKGADSLRADLAAHNGDITKPLQGDFSSALRNVVGDIRAKRQRQGEEIDFEGKFRTKLCALAEPGALELSLVPLSHLGQPRAFIPILAGPEIGTQVERFLQDELKVDRSQTKNLVHPRTSLWRKDSASEVVTPLLVTEQISSWLKQILEDNSRIPGAHVSLALVRKNKEVQIGFMVSLEPVEALPPQHSLISGKRHAVHSQGASALSESLGPLIGIAQNVQDTLILLYCAATAERKKLHQHGTIGNFLCATHSLVTTVYCMSSLPFIGIALLTGEPLNISMWGWYCLASGGINGCSVLYEKGRERYQSSKRSAVAGDSEENSPR